MYFNIVIKRISHRMKKQVKKRKALCFKKSPIKKINVKVIKTDIDESDKKNITAKHENSAVYIQPTAFVHEGDDTDVKEISDQLYNFDKNKTISIKTYNFESFLRTHKYLRYFDFVFEKSETNTVNRIKKYRNLENEMNVIDKRGVLISFNPDIISSIRSSLVNPALYLHTCEDLSSKLFNFIAIGPKSLKDLKTGFKQTIENELKSLIFIGIVKIKRGKFVVNEFLD